MTASCSAVTEIFDKSTTDLCLFTFTLNQCSLTINSFAPRTYIRHRNELELAIA